MKFPFREAPPCACLSVGRGGELHNPDVQLGVVNRYLFLLDKLNRDFYRAGHIKSFYASVYLSEDYKSA